MIVTIILFIVDWLVLIANDIPILPTHSLYLIFLTFILWKRKQPDSYSSSVEEITKICEQRKISLPEKIKECQICQKAKPDRYYHCRHCNKCVYRLDHHCNFVGNCIGQHNSKVYVHLLANTLIHSLSILIVTITHYQNLLNFTSKQALFTLTLLPTLFGIYETQRLLRAFWTTVHRNQTLIQSYKQVRGQKLSNMTSFQAYFSKDKIRWFFPTFQKNENCNIFQKTYPVEREAEIKEYKYADQYLYGPDQQEDQFYEKNV